MGMDARCCDFAGRNHTKSAVRKEGQKKDEEKSGEMKAEKKGGGSQFKENLRKGEMGGYNSDINGHEIHEKKRKEVAHEREKIDNL